MKDALCLRKELTSKLQLKINSLAQLQQSFQIGAVWNVFFACGGVLALGEPVSKCLPQLSLGPRGLICSGFIVL